RLFYLGGVSSLAKTRGATLTALRGIVASLGGQRIFCYGNSSGVFAALHYGLDLNAKAVLCPGGITNISPEFNSRLAAGGDHTRVSEELPHIRVELRQAYSTGERPPRACIVYAEHNWDDRIHAEHMSGLPSVTLQTVSGSTRHNVVVDLIQRGDYEG